jgi:hypothetical protein
MRTKLIILTSIAMALVVMAFPTNKFQPKTVWEHYCKYTLGIHPSQATEEQYDYFLDCWSGDDEYTYLYDYYENKYPEYNQELKHYGKMKITITTLIIVNDNEVLDVYHSLEDNQDKAYQELIDMVEGEYGDEETNTHFKSIEDIEDYFDIVSIETQELTPRDFKTAILDQ